MWLPLPGASLGRAGGGVSRPVGVGTPSHMTDEGVDPRQLEDSTLLTELEHLHDTRNTTLRHGSGDALAAHTRRTRELEDEYLRRWPRREVDPARTRDGTSG